MECDSTFSPYLEYADGSWNEALRPAIEQALRASSDYEYTQVLLRLLAKLRDGHGILIGINPKFGGLPVRVQYIDGHIVVVGSMDDCPLKVGDIVETIDGKDASSVLAELESYSPGSPQTSRFRAMNRLGAGPIGSIARVGIIRGGEERKSVEIERREDERSYYSNGVAEFESPPFAELAPGIFYVNIWTMEADEYKLRWPELAKAKAIIFDHRSGGKNYAKKSIEPHQDIIPHLIEHRVHYAPMSLPIVVRPDHEEARFTTPGVQTVEPAAPRFAGKMYL